MGSGVKKIGPQFFCVFDTFEVLEKHKIENEHENPARIHFVIHYYFNHATKACHAITSPHINSDCSTTTASWQPLAGVSVTLIMKQRLDTQ